MSIESKELNGITLPREDVNKLVKITKDGDNGSIFMACRSLQDMAAQNNSQITNIGEVYFWIRETRDKLVEASKKE